MLKWLRDAINELAVGETHDPAGVAEHPIKLNGSRAEALRKLRMALDRLELAVELETAGYQVLAHRELARLSYDPITLPGPDPDDVLEEEARRRLARKREGGGAIGARAVVAERGAASPRPRESVRSWGV